MASNIKLEAAREFILGNDYDTARTILHTLQSASPTAQKWLAKLDEIAPQTVAMNGSASTMHSWEYLEVYVKASDKLPAVDFASVLDEQELTTVNHFYTRLLNDYGAQGWELVSEEQHGGDVIRLLFKRVKV
jgi:hypothetical protein